MPHCLSILKLCQNITRRLVSGKYGECDKDDISLCYSSFSPRQIDSASDYYKPNSKSSNSVINEEIKSESLFSTLEKNLSKEQRAEIVIITRAIGPRVDDVVRAMYPPLDPRLLEARLTSLYLAVCHLVYVTNKSMSSEFQNEIAMQKHWLNQSILRIEDNLKVLRKVSLAFDTCIQLQNLSYATENFRYDKIGKNFPNQNIAVISL
ncbi:unnamed protein product [Gordionus sp. m RMFG-2023]